MENQYTGPDRRTSTMSSIDPQKFGELVATVKNLGENQDAGFIRIEKAFDEFRQSHDLQARKDYEYLDDKIDKVKADMKPLLEAHSLRSKGWAATVRAKASELVISSVLLFILAAVGWGLIQYIKSGV